MDDAERARQGMAIRRAVVGDAHVDRAAAAATPFTEPFQDFITRYAWGEIWSRPGLSRAERSIVTLAVLAALRHEDELALHVRAALRNGLSAGADPGGPAPGGRVRGRPGRQSRVQGGRAGARRGRRGPARRVTLSGGRPCPAGERLSSWRSRRRYRFELTGLRNLHGREP